MNKQISDTQELILSEDTLRDLLDIEIMLIGGGEASQTTY